MVRDAWLRAHCEEFVELLREDEDELRRRVESAKHYLPLRPKDQLEVNLQECPVCSYGTLLTSSSDPFGFGVGVGTCLVCSYCRDSEIAEIEATGLKIDYELSKDD